MKKQICSYLLLLTLAFGVSAQKTKKAKPDLTEKNLRIHVSYLASDKLEGRRTGEKGATFAAGYVANMFARYRLKAGYKSTNSFLQPFPYIAGVELNNASSLKITDTRKVSDIDLKTEWAPLGFSPNAKISYSPMTFVGFGISSQKLKYDDYGDIDVKGKVVWALDGLPDNDNPHNMFFLFNAHAKAKIAKEKGAKALILISRKQNFADDKLALRFNQTLGETAIPTIVMSRQAAAKILKAKEQNLVNEEKILNAKAKGANNGSSKGGIRKNQTLLANIKVALVKKEVQAYNVIGIIEGHDPILKNEAIIIGAHYDHLGRGGSGSLAVNSKDIHHGADDNASGTSAMLELARSFSKNKTNKRTLIFMGFGGEEEGLLGSKAYVNNPVFPLEKTVAMINMDMVGRLQNGKLTVGGIGTAEIWNALVTNLQPKTLGKVLVGKNANTAIKNGEKYTPVSISINGKVAVAKAEDKNLFKLQLNQDGFGPSDHSSFYGKKVPVLFFFTGTHADYHKPSDTADKINYKGLLSIGNFVSKLVRAIDQNPNRPVYKVAKSSGMSGGRRGFNVSLGTVPSYADGNNDGLVLDGVRDNSPASKAGIKSGDKIIKLAGKEIRNISDYVFVLGEMKADKEYEVIVMRGKEKLELKITPKKR